MPYKMKTGVMMAGSEDCNLAGITLEKAGCGWNRRKFLGPVDGLTQAQVLGFPREDLSES